MNRSRHHSARHVPYKTALLIVGGATGLVGMLLDIHWMVLLAIAIVGVGFLLRFLPGPDESDDGVRPDHIPPGGSE
ncbi:MAG TPA: hypothetical protein VJ992_06210 [Gemmatimonadales bacterium]|nr:hypothetical protein [Gemmatimonadales bacterium]